MSQQPIQAPFPLVRTLGLVLAILAATATGALAQDAGIPVETDAVGLSIGGRVQTQLNTTSVDGLPTSQLLIRRARIEISVVINDRLTGELDPDFGGGEVELKDAFLQYEFSPALKVLAGKAYRPFGLMEQTSSKRILPVERGLRIRGVSAVDEYAALSGLDYSDRDIGLKVHGAPEAAPLGLTYAAGVFRGPLHGEAGDQDSYQFAARVTMRPIQMLRLGAGWSSRDFTDGLVDPGLRRGHAFEVDLEYGAFAPGLHVMAEASTGDLDPYADATFRGVQAWLAYRTEAVGRHEVAFEPVFRASYADTEGEALLGTVPGGALLTPGLNIYLTPQNRLMLNYDVWRGAGSSGDATSFKAMVQLGF